jgi:mRNA-degrading endonuclease RelE of RelBE toxin-antitoxin system
MNIYLTRTAVESIGELEKEDIERLFGVLERIRIRPGRYLRKLINDPGYRLRMEGVRIYLDIAEDDIVVLLVKTNNTQ